MQIITPHYILLGDRVSTNLSVAYDKTIKKIAPYEELIDAFPNAKVSSLRENSLLMPGLINAHVHVEFSANKTELSYGDF
ncbi:MAG: metal-dependent hydrolase, partial [Thiovulaceae bacterium]|nr:metal-dependent hydrolase [Sulfurimonadaceae bacterium]